MNTTKKHIPEHHQNHERWMVSYADFVTLLFAVFVVLFAYSQTNRDSPQQIAESVSHALRHGSLRDAIRVLRSAPAPADQGPKQPELAPSLELLTQQLKDEIEAGKIAIALEPRGLLISLRQAAFFPSGVATIAPEAFPTIEKLSKVIAGLPNSVRIEGHTDAVPINNSRYTSNWELSAARSIAMLERLVGRHGLNRARFSIAGFADTDPLSPNSDSEGRARNRRVDLLILNTAPGLP